jgi:HK97 family phage major capsid protein
MNPIELLRNAIAALKETRDGLYAEMDAILVAPTAEARSLTEDETSRFNAVPAKIIDLNKDIDAQEQRLAELVEVEARRERVPKNINVNRGDAKDPFDIELRTLPRTAETVADLRERARFAVDRSKGAESVHALLDDPRVDRNGALARHIIATGRPAYRSAWSKLVTQTSPILTADEGRAVEEVRNMEITTDNQGGFLMPFTLDPTIILTNNSAINPIRAHATVRTTATDNWQGVSSAGVTAAYGAEAAEVADGTPTLAQPTVAIHKAHAFVPFTLEAEDDLAGLAADITMMFGDAKERLEASSFTLGTGTAQPFGIVTAVAAVAGSRIASATADVYAVADVYALQNGLAARHRANAKWMAALPTINLTRAFGAAVGHAFLTDLAGGIPPLLLGQQLLENSEMDGVINAAADNDMVLYGDFAKYRIHDRIGLSIELIPHLFGANRRPTGERGWYARWRNGANVVDANAFRLLRV